jgi:hypothetical protein
LIGYGHLRPDYRQEQMGKVRIAGAGPDGVAANTSRPPH